MQLVGTITTAFIDCPGADTIVTFELDTVNYCVNIFAVGDVVASHDSACFIICDDLGQCDTTMIVISLSGPTGMIPNALGDTISTVKGEFVTFNPLINDTIDLADNLGIVTLPSNGSVTVNPEGS